MGKSINGLLGNNEGTMENCYYISSASNKMQIESSIGTTINCGEKTEEEMKNDEFVKQLNEDANEAIWKKDENNINNGYPIFNWQEK